MDHDSENPHASLLPRAAWGSRLPSPNKSTRFGEISASSVNARNGEMPPPPTEAVTGEKRKTLAERAGEPFRKPPAPGINKQLNSGMKASTLAGAYRQPSFSSSVASSRPSSVASSRNVSNASYTSTMSTGSRPPSRQAHRPQSAMAGSRIQKPQSVQSRPFSSMDAPVSGPATGRGPGKSSGRTLFPSNLVDCPEILECTEGNMSHDTQSQTVSNRASSNSLENRHRAISISTAMDGLSLDEPWADCNPWTTQKRDASLMTALENMSLNSKEPGSFPSSSNPATPSQIPKRKPSAAVHAPLHSPIKSPKKAPAPSPRFLNRHTNMPFIEAFDPDDRLSNMESMMSEFKNTLNGATTESNGLREMVAVYKARVAELDSMRVQLTVSNETLLSDLNATRADLNASSIALEDSKRNHNIQLDDLHRQHRRDLEDSQRQAQDEMSQLERRHALEHDDLKRRLDIGLEEERTRHQQELQALTSARTKSQEEMEGQLEQQRKKVEAVENELRNARTDVVCEQNLNSNLRIKLSEAASNTINLESSIRSLRAHVEFLESDNKSQSHAFSDLDNRLQNAIKAAEEAKEKLRAEETLRRKLHNQVQELKGNIRVFCRVRPSLESDPTDAKARISFPDHDCDAKEVEVYGPEEKNSLGKVSTRTNAFTFDRVFNPKSANADVFGEISQLVQSALDGYNVCIFCYGQTGSGKTYTMSAEDGMIPRAVNQIYDTAKSLEEKGWKYTMEGSFVEVYNENLNDLLGKPDEMDKKKHEIRHDMQKCKTTITDITTVDLDSPNKVDSILRQAASNRSVAATKANERSSRSHSVFILKLTGENSTTGEKSEGSLNLVDLAGSERLSQSQATGERLKETQSINKSLSCLGDVIGALGQGKEGGHVPYRNSKLTYLLQFSLGGNSKTLMFVMISPLQAHLSETLTSLKFATKVHNTHIGTAKKQAKVRDS
ncbi:MAG: hypothetical protein Q9225_002055 [Loekoesia sp. 1 TL-2023]